MPSLPTDETSLYHWFAGLMVLYILMAYFIGWCRERMLFVHKTQREVLSRVFDSVTFAGSATLLAGIFDDNVLKAIGNTKPFLLIAGMAGVIWSLHALAPKPPDERPP